MSQLLTQIGLYRETVDPTPIIERPESALWENVHRRTRTGKSFRLKSGLNRQIISIGPQHYWDGGWQDINCNIEAWDSKTFELWKAAYFWRNQPGRVGCVYKSRKGGFARMYLKSFQPTIPYAKDNNLHYPAVALDTDVHFQLRPEVCAAWITLHSEHAPRQWEWEFYHRKPIGIARNVRGWDANGNQLDLHIDSSTEKLGNGLRRTRLVKRWSGAAVEQFGRRRDTRLVDPAYPVVIDPDISEEIVDDNDDGTDGGFWSNTKVQLGDLGGGDLHPGFRFQGIAIDQADTIDLSTFKIYMGYSMGSGGSGTIYGYDTDDAAAWGTPLPSTVTKTSASTSWPASASSGQKTFTVTSIVQEIVDRGSWGNGNDMSVFGISDAAANNGSQFADYPSSGNHGRLEIDYTGGGAGTSPKGPLGHPLRGALGGPI